MNRLVVLMDFSNYVHTCWWPAVAANKADSKYDPHEVLKTNLLGKLSTTKRAVEECGYTDFDLWFVEDRPATRKFKIYPLYKANREQGDVDPRPEAKEFLKTQGYIHFVFSPDNEADDTIATLTRLVHDEADTDVIIGTSDKDLWQLIRPGVDVYSLTKDVFVTPEMITNAFDVTSPSKIPLVKSLWGDSGDNVPNAVPRMQKQLLPIVEECDGTVPDFWEAWAIHKTTTRCNELLDLGAKQILVNWELVKLRTDCPLVFEFKP